MKLEELFSPNIKLHRDGNGNPVNYKISQELVNFLSDITTNEKTTLETGAGISTVFFARQGTKHHCIAPDEELFSRIKQFCKTKNIKTNKITFYPQASEYLLPSFKKKIDIALIDGKHAFPSPFIDWFYIEPNLSIGGYLIIDDIQLWTGKVLTDFLKQEPEWELIRVINAETSIFQKVNNGSTDKWWGQQPYVVNESRPLQYITKIKQLIKLS